MKKLSILLLLLCITIFSCKQEHSLKEGNYRINGTVTGLENGEVYLLSNRKVDTILIKNGTFTIEDSINKYVKAIKISKSPNPMQLRDLNSVLPLLVEPEILSLDLNYNDFSKSELKGSDSQDDQYKLDALLNAIANDYKSEQAVFDSITIKYKKAKKNGASHEELEAIKYEDNEARGKLSPKWDRQNQATLQFIKDNPKSYVSFQSFLYQISNLEYAEAKAILDNLNPNYLTTKLGKTISKEVENLQKGISGTMAADFNTKDIDGNPIKLADFKGQYLLIDFWASWCVPCRKGNPHLLDLYAKYKDKNFEILGVSDDDRNPEAWRKAVQKDGIGVWRHILRGMEVDTTDGRFKVIEQGITEGYNIPSLPTKILVGPDGQIVGRYDGSNEDEKALDEKLVDVLE